VEALLAEADENRTADRLVAATARSAVAPDPSAQAGPLWDRFAREVQLLEDEARADWMKAAGIVPSRT
ncbi:MAG: hypothetical protein KC613_21555, partial [Myxococcales bacterium]|nr:hypothetical protein [Myxococcales bacterium]